MQAERGSPTLEPRRLVNPHGEELVSEAKSYVIPKQLVWDAYQRVKANQGAAGVDGESLAMFEQDLKNNLYRVWNRMSSGSYFPPPVRLVEIEKDDGGIRPLGIPTVADRVAQTVVKMVLEPKVEPQFHADSYGYRPGKSALDAVGMARSKCVHVLRHLNEALAGWVRRKYKRFRRRARASMHWLGGIAQRDPGLFVLWQLGVKPAARG
jgi:RNA-directed DNA polymerase